LHTIDGADYRKKLAKLVFSITNALGDYKDTSALGLNFKDNYIYYKKYGRGGSLCRYSFDTGNISELAPTVQKYALTDKFIYYVDQTQNNILCRMNYDGTCKTQISDINI